MAKAEANKNGRFLALIPIVIGVLLALLLFPHDAAPDDVPMPDVDMRRLDAIERADDARAHHAEASPLPAEVRALGDAMRSFDTTEAKDPPHAPWPDLRLAVDDARALALQKGDDAVLDLRAVQLVHFLDEVHAWRKTGKESPELDALAGGFVRRMTMTGYIKNGALIATDRELRVMFKLRWNAVARLDAVPAFAPTLDEMRAFYMFDLLHPHPTEAARNTLAAARKNAKTRADCDALAAGEQIAAEQWRLDKIEKLARIDPTYPAAYARGVALYRTTKFDESARAFEEWLRVHPDGPLTIRARNHLRAAIAASRNL
ncbi:MAG TPA: hypothetical protein VGH28_01300 [Polyangiaceae bacterium]|jgi:hypothetical protein